MTFNIPSVATQTGAVSYETYATQMADKYGLDAVVFRAMLRKESGLSQTDKAGNVKIGDAGEIGIGQLKPGTAAEVGVDPYDPYQNIEGAAKYLKKQLDATGNMHSALAAYNQGLAGSRGKGSQAGKQYADSVLQAAADESPAPLSWFDKMTTEIDKGGSGIFGSIAQNGAIIVAGLAVVIVALVLSGRSAAISTVKEAIK